MKYKYYKAYMACRDNSLRTVSITTDATDNSSTKELKITGCSIEMDSDEDVLTPVRIKRGKISIQCNDDDLNIGDLLPTSLMSHEIIINGPHGIEFDGYITSESSSQSYPNKGNDFDLQFVSRLGVCESLNFYPYKENGDLFPSSRPKFINILSYIFTSCGFGSQDEMTLPLVIDPWKEVRTSGEFNCWTELCTGLYQFAHVDSIRNIDTHYFGIEDYTYATTNMLEVLTNIAKFFCVSFREEGLNIVAYSPWSSTYKKTEIVDQGMDPWHSDFAFTNVSMGSKDITYDQFITDSTINLYNGANQTSLSLGIDTTANPYETSIDICEYDKTCNAPIFNNDNHKIDAYKNKSGDGLIEVFGTTSTLYNRTVFSGGVIARLQNGTGRDFPVSEGIFWGGYQVTSTSANVAKFMPKTLLYRDVNYSLEAFEMTFDVLCGSVSSDSFCQLPSNCNIYISIGSNSYKASLDNYSGDINRMKVEIAHVSPVITQPMYIQIKDGANNLANYTLIFSNIEFSLQRYVERKKVSSKDYIYRNDSIGSTYEIKCDLGCWSNKIADIPLNAVTFVSDKDSQGSVFWGYYFNDCFTGDSHTEYDYEDPQHPFPYEVYDMEDYGDVLIRKINDLKKNTTRVFEIGVEIESVLDNSMINFVDFDGYETQITGFTRDYMTGIDKIKLTQT